MFDEAAENPPFGLAYPCSHDVIDKVVLPYVFG